MSEVPAVVDGDKPEVRKRGHYQISARLQRVLMLLASGEAKTQREACDAVGMTPRALQAAMKRPNVRTHMQEMIMTSLGVSAMKAAKRMDELLNSSNEMVSFQASRFALATGAGVAPPSQPAMHVNVAVQAGFVIDLSPEPGELEGSVVRPAIPSTGAVVSLVPAPRPLQSHEVTPVGRPLPD